jgi:DNA-binding response OmpR family regulator
MTRVLVVERRDPPRAAAVLEREGFTVVTAVHPSEARALLSSYTPDLVLVESSRLDRSLVDGCAAIRGSVSAPIVIVSGPYAERDAVSAFSVGVDGLVLADVGAHELIARLRALLRRTSAPPKRSPTNDRITVGPVVLDLARRELSVDGEVIRLPRREFDIARILMREAGRVVSRKALVDELWGTARDTKSLDVQVGRLRARLAAVEGRRRIVTVRGVGYRFVADEGEDGEVAASADPNPLVVPLAIELREGATDVAPPPETLRLTAS